eukprot:TRINITY_DN773119_c0_g1_i1.p1 TRINITY_DN773119_c0_g1~~TRINITY_DN773119_c0_g1_i1.p1  ORF type:complete len:350 (-),score=89.98 TRINITY_DN773119_c0_g1_i1:1318-2367(-)
MSTANIELEQIVKKLSKKTEWNIRLKAFSSLTAFCEEYMEISKTHIPTLLTNFNSNLKDPRSQIVKAACQCLEDCSNLNPANFIPFFESILPTLMELVGSGNKVNAAYAKTSLQAVIEMCPSRKSVLHLIEAANSRNNTIAEQSLECIKLALENWEDSYLLRALSESMDDLSVCMVDGLQGRSQKRREISRSIFPHIERLWPAVAKRTFTVLDSRVKTLLRGGSSNSVTPSTPTQNRAGSSPSTPQSQKRRSTPATPHSVQSPRPTLTSTSSAVSLSPELEKEMKTLTNKMEGVSAGCLEVVESLLVSVKKMQNQPANAQKIAEMQALLKQNVETLEMICSDVKSDDIH